MVASYEILTLGDELKTDDKLDLRKLIRYMVDKQRDESFKMILKSEYGIHNVELKVSAPDILFELENK